MTDGGQKGALVPVNAKAEIVSASGADNMLREIRAEWQAKELITRTARLLPVDPSSACQRLLNATIHDLRQKILVAGIDLAKEAATRFGLPSISKPEDISENYTTARIIDLAYRMGILARSEWRRIRRCYEIRKDLEHEDDEYEADVEDILYIFKNCIKLVLSRDPIDIIRVEDVNDLVDAPQAPTVSAELREEYEHAPDTRQRDILEHLINGALNSKKPDVVRHNSVELLREFKPITKNAVSVQLGEMLQERYRRRRLDLLVVKVAYAAGVLPYLKRRKISEFFEWIHTRLEDIGHQWRQFNAHREPLEDLEDVGGLNHCPPEPRAKLVLWMVLCYLGEPGGYGTWGQNRSVFYSDIAAPRIRQLFESAGVAISPDVDSARKDKRVKAAIRSHAIARRLETLEDLISQ